MIDRPIRRDPTCKKRPIPPHQEPLSPKTASTNFSARHGPTVYGFLTQFHPRRCVRLMNLPASVRRAPILRPPALSFSERSKPRSVFVPRLQAATPCAYARSRTPDRPMAQVDCAGTLQLPCGTGEPRQSLRIPGSAHRAVVANTSPPQPETPDLLAPYSRSG